MLSINHEHELRSGNSGSEFEPIQSLGSDEYPSSFRCGGIGYTILQIGSSGSRVVSVGVVEVLDLSRSHPNA